MIEIRSKLSIGSQQFLDAESYPKRFKKINKIADK